MIDDFLAGIPEADDFIIRLQNIIGGKYKDGILKLDFSLDMDTPEEIRKARAKMILIRQELKSLRGEVVRAVYRINAEFLRLKGHYPGASEAIKAVENFWTGTSAALKTSIALLRSVPSLATAKICVRSCVYPWMNSSAFANPSRANCRKIAAAAVNCIPFVLML